MGGGIGNENIVNDLKPYAHFFSSETHHYSTTSQDSNDYITDGKARDEGLSGTLRTFSNS